MKNIFFLILFSGMIVLCGCPSNEENPIVTPPPIDSCNNANENLYYASRFPIGTAVNYDAWKSDPEYAQLLSKHFNSVTAENIMKPAYLHPDENIYRWELADELADYCKNKSIRLHGHTLLWHSQLPSWMQFYQGDEAAWDVMMKNHIQTIVRHFKGKVAAWDIVNEAFEEDGSFRRSVWYVQLGESYIEKAILYAKEADPNVLLFYNDYNLEFNALKRSAVLAHFGKLRAKGITIDGIGVQMHIFHVYPSPLMIRECLNEIAKENYKIHISEMDVSVNPLSVDVEYTDSVQTLQMQQYETVLNAYEQIPAELQYGCTFWGITDKYTWIRSSFLREDYPLLFDDNYKKKKSFNAVKFALCK